MKQDSQIQWTSILVAVGMAFLMGGCTGKGLFNAKLFKERAAETPVPTEEGIAKSFFVDPSGKPKTFLCAFAPEASRGFWGERENLLFAEAGTPHCNVEFEITENYLIARQVNPSFLNDRDRWTELLRIPIIKHYYYERAKDEHGRETNNWIENDQRSHWSARPMIKLNLAGITWHQGLESQGIDSSYHVTSVEDIEWDFPRNFLGFSANIVNGADDQAKIRVNFLAFQHDPNFKKVPYAQEDARYMNILHVMGRKVEGVVPELFAGHWDLSKPHKIFINGATEPAVANMIVRAIDEWNVTLAKIGAIKPGTRVFIPILRTLNHPFDLRYPSITWVSDRRIAPYSPLGIGMAHADVRNGEILWGGIVLFGGELEDYINAYTPVSGGAATTAKSAGLDLSPIYAFTQNFPKAFRMIQRFDMVDESKRQGYLQNFTADHSHYLMQQIQQAIAANAQPGKKMDLSKQIANLQQQLKGFQSPNANLNMVVADLIKQAGQEDNSVKQFFGGKSIQNLFGIQSMDPSQVKTAETKALQKHYPALAKALMEPNASRRRQMLVNLMTRDSASFNDNELTAENLVGGWMNSEAQKTLTYQDMFDSVVLNLTLHEFGHFIGLGHQFKENIIPKTGTVPSKYIATLKAEEKDNLKNFTSVMGYMSGRTEMLLDKDEVKPGPHDELVLRYLYKDQYSVYDKAKDDFAYVTVPSTGKIPQTTMVDGKEMRTSYFPQCNDFEASLGADPFCNRWDRGNTATDITKNYFQEVSDNLIANLYSLVGGGSDEWYAEARMWSISLRSFSRVRMFYDEMRRLLQTDKRYAPIWNRIRNDEDALFRFSSCHGNPNAKPGQDPLNDLFQYDQMRDLCQANAVAMKELGFFLTLPQSDYTKIDYANRYIGGGFLAGDATQVDGHAFGSWYELTNLPLKFSALYTLTTSTPYVSMGGYLFGDPYYDNESNRFLYRTLYPREFTKTVSNAVISNMRFAATGTDNTTNIGRTILAMGSMLPWQKYTGNESARLPENYNRRLNQQDEFQYSMVAVVVSATQPDSNSHLEANHYRKFTGQIYDFFTGKNTTVSDLYILPQGDVFVRANGMFIYPVTKLKFFSDTEGYVIAYKVSYDYEQGDQLVEDSVKSALLEEHNAIARICLDGFKGNGLSHYFNNSNPDFGGFNIPSHIAEEVGKEKIGLFYDSVQKEFDNYEKWALANHQIPDGYPLKNMEAVCDEALRGVGVVSASASLLNGYWLGITPNYLEQ